VKVGQNSPRWKRDVGKLEVSIFSWLCSGFPMCKDKIKLISALERVPENKTRTNQMADKDTPSHPRPEITLQVANLRLADM